MNWRDQFLSDVWNICTDAFSPQRVNPSFPEHLLQRNWWKYAQMMYGSGYMPTTLLRFVSLYKVLWEIRVNIFTCSESARSAADFTLGCFTSVINNLARFRERETETDDIYIPHKLVSQAWNCVWVTSHIVASILNEFHFFSRCLHLAQSRCGRKDGSNLAEISLWCICALVLF